MFQEPGDSSRDLLITYLEVTNNHLKGHVFTIPKRSPTELAGRAFYEGCDFLRRDLFFGEMI